jgi:hypothetical protein
MAKAKRARLEDINEFAMAMPHVEASDSAGTHPEYAVGGKSFIIFRTPRADALDPETAERLTDVIIFWVSSDDDKQALVQDESNPFFTTPHFDGHRSILIRASRIGELSRQELQETVEEAWLARASRTWVKEWINEQEASGHR